MSTYGDTGSVLTIASTTTAAVPVPANVTANKLVFVSLYLEASRTVTAPAGGWTLLNGTPLVGPQQWHYIYWKIANAADSGTYTFSWTTAASRVAVAWTVNDPHLTDPIEAFATAINSGSVQLTTLGPSRTLIYVPSDFLAGTWTFPTGFTSRVNAGSEVALASREQAAAGSTGALSGSVNNQDRTTIWLIAVRGPDESAATGGFFPFFS